MSQPSPTPRPPTPYRATVLMCSPANPNIPRQPINPPHSICPTLHNPRLPPPYLASVLMSSTTSSSCTALRKDQPQKPHLSGQMHTGSAPHAPVRKMHSPVSSATVAVSTWNTSHNRRNTLSAKQGMVGLERQKSNNGGSGDVALFKTLQTAGAYTLLMSF
jgi:hypothetical protein